MQRRPPHSDEEIDSDEIPDLSDGTDGEESEDAFYDPGPDPDRDAYLRAKAQLQARGKALQGDEDALREQVARDAAEVSGYRLEATDLRPTESPPVRYRAHRGAPTSLALDEHSVFSVGKEGTVVKIAFDPLEPKTRKRLIEELRRSSQILSVAFHKGTGVLATGEHNGDVVLWIPPEYTETRELKGHTGPVTGVVFQEDGVNLFSCSFDLTVRVWDVETGNCMATLFGHQDKINWIDMCGGIVVTCGSDRTVRLWKYEEEKQLVFIDTGAKASMDTLAMVNRSVAISGSQDGRLCLWDLGRKKPLYTVRDAHGPCAWISAVAAFKYHRLCASGSCDGFVRFWEIEDRKLVPAGVVPLVGFIVDMQFSPDGEFLVVQVSREQRLGRWLPTNKEARQGVYLIRLAPNGK